MINVVCQLASLFERLKQCLVFVGAGDQLIPEVFVHLFPVSAGLRAARISTVCTNGRHSHTQWSALSPTYAQARWRYCLASAVDMRKQQHNV